MRILQIAPPWFAVPPDGYGGIEAVVSLLADGLVAAGHDVELVASGGSRTTARLRTVHAVPPSEALGDVSVELDHVLAAYAGADGADLIHDHSGLVGPALGAFATTAPVVHTLHGPWTATNHRVYRQLASRVHLVAISGDQARRRPPGLPVAGVVHNGIDVDAYPLARERGDHLLFVGRANPEKGPEVAIEVARLLGRPLAMAIKVNEPPEHAYFRDVIRPAMRGVEVEVFPNAKLPFKAELMGRAACLLFPIRWPEPFGLVMAEAMACGTPVVGYANGAAPEVVDHGTTGFLVPEGDVEALAEGVLAAVELDPEACRRHVIANFSAERMVQRYLALYERILTAPPRADLLVTAS